MAIGDLEFLAFDVVVRHVDDDAVDVHPEPLTECLEIALRRPRLAEHALNRVAHGDPPLVSRLVDANEAASAAQSAAIGGAKTSLREATTALRDVTRAVIDAAVRGLEESGASGEGQRGCVLAYEPIGRR